jgi:hypothetical protein
LFTIRRSRCHCSRAGHPIHSSRGRHLNDAVDQPSSASHRRRPPPRTAAPHRPAPNSSGSDARGQAIERLPLVGSHRAHNDPSQVNCHVGHVEPSKQLLFRKSEENATTPFFTTSRSHDGVLPPPRPNVKYRKRKSFVGSTRAPGPGRLPWPRTPQRTRSRSADRGGEPALCHQPAVCDLPGRAASVVARCDVRTRPAFRSDATWHRGRRYRRNAGGRHVGSNRCEGSLEKSAFRSDADRRPRTGYSCTRTTPPAGPIVTLRTANSAPSSRTS